MPKRKTKQAPVVDEEPEFAEAPNPAEFLVQPFKLPGAPRPPKAGIVGSMLWVFGLQGVGKTTLAADFPGAWIVATEKGQDYVETREPVMIHSWEHFLAWCAWVEETKPTKFEDGEPIRTVVIDTVSGLFKMCTDDVSAGLGVEDPAELDHGKGWARLNNEFHRVMSKVRRWPFTLVVISHARDSRELTIRGRKITRVEPDIGAGGMRILSQLSDFIFFCGMGDRPIVADGQATGAFEEYRYLNLHPTTNIIGKCRRRDLPQSIPLSYRHLMAAFAGKELDE